MSGIPYRNKKKDLIMHAILNHSSYHLSRVSWASETPGKSVVATDAKMNSFWIPSKSTKSRKTAVHALWHEPWPRRRACAVHYRTKNPTHAVQPNFRPPFYVDNYKAVGAVYIYMQCCLSRDMAMPLRELQTVLPWFGVHIHVAMNSHMQITSTACSYTLSFNAQIAKHRI